VAFDLTAPGAGAVNAVVSSAGIRRHWRRHLNLKRAGSTRVRVRVAVNPKHALVTLAVTYKPTGGTDRTVRIKALQVP
jgi:hypothetical protein